MKKIVTIMMFFSLVLVTACGTKQDVKQDVLQQSFTEIAKDAKGSTVNLFMWGGDQNINRYIDEWVAPKLKKETGVTLRRRPMDTKQFIEKLVNEKKANRQKGTIDVIWINGENFKRAKDENVLFGSFAKKLPNIQYISTTLQQSDTGEMINGLEVPWGNVQYAFQYNEKYVKQPPKTWNELQNLVKQYPGKFTYPETKDFTGNAFIRHVLYEQNGRNLQEPTDQQLDTAYRELNDIKPYLWKEGKTYPPSLEQLDRLYASEEVWFTMGFNERRAEPFMKNGVFPTTTKSFIFQTGSIASTHFLSIPFNAPNVKGALVAINYLLSPEAQAAKQDIRNWGDGTVIDVTKLQEKERAKFVQSGGSSLTPEQFEGKVLPELRAKTISAIEKTWYDKVANK